jgi:hypothetical protein
VVNTLGSGRGAQPPLSLAYIRNFLNTVIMIRKFIRALMGKEDFEVDIEVEIDIVDFLFLIAFIALFVWMIIVI